jgi:hypothetical protein
MARKNSYKTGRPEGSAATRSGFFYIIGRVSSIVLSDLVEGTKEANPDFKSFGDIGKISFEILYSSLTTSKSKHVSDYAYPFFSFINQYPLINEIVIIFPGPSEALNDDFQSKQLFYLPPYNLWKFNPNHSAFPNMLEYQQFLLDYYSSHPDISGKGDTTLELFLGEYFKETNKVRKLKPFEGDIILESRFGQSVRFGSTTPKVKKSNYWSNKGPQGSPITMIVNGQGAPENSKDIFAPTLENINKDFSSIYLTKDQQIVIEDLNNFDFRSFGGINAQAQERTDNVRMSNPPIISNEEVDSNTQDKKAIG